MLSGRVVDAAAPDIELVAAHAPMVDSPGHHIACHNGVAEWVLVGHPLVSDATICDSKLLAAVLAVIHEARPDTAANRSIAKRACVLECLAVVLFEAAAGLAWLRRSTSMWCRRCSRNTCFLWTRMVRACLAVAWSRRGGSGFRATLRLLKRVDNDI